MVSIPQRSNNLWSIRETCQEVVALIETELSSDPDNNRAVNDKLADLHKQIEPLIGKTDGLTNVVPHIRVPKLRPVK